MSSQPATVAQPGRNAYDATRKGHAHGIPSVPFTIDGEKGNPVHLVALRDRPLHTVVSLEDKGVGKPSIQIFTEKEPSVAAMRELGGERADVDNAPLPAASPRVRLGLDLDLTIWEDTDLTGCAWEFDTGTDISVLTDFDNAWSCGFLFWNWRQLGTNASSFIVRIGWPFFGFSDRSGSTIGWLLNPPSGIGTLPSGLVSDLGSFGWNDRATSIHLPGATFP